MYFKYLPLNLAGNSLHCVINPGTVWYERPPCCSCSEPALENWPDLWPSKPCKKKKGKKLHICKMSLTEKKTKQDINKEITFNVLPSPPDIFRITNSDHFFLSFLLWSQWTTPSVKQWDFYWFTVHHEAKVVHYRDLGLNCYRCCTKLIMTVCILIMYICGTLSQDAY